MEWYQRHKSLLAQVYAEAGQRIAQFPAPLHKAGLVYADKFNPVKDDNGKDYICSLLPFWIKEPTGISDSQCRQLALANVYGMLYFFIQDDVMDGIPSANWKEQLALGNLLLLEMLAVLRGLFPSDSPFWSYYHQYVTIWADSVMNESRDNYLMTEPLRMAGKAGPVKIASTGAMLLSGKTESIGQLELAVDIVLTTLQMSDDWVDWKDDLADGSYNGLLAQVAAGLGRDTHEKLSVQEIENAIYVRGCLKPYVQIACDNHERLLTLEIGAGELVDFHSYLLDHLTQTAEAIDANKLLLQKGGFNYFLASQLNDG
ncbi:hypothetical protein [Paenibacillus harenae]|uniref:hypothetical protein n=1 Tax=Paenibacillus harenae TaxID=306543 RepID=UPI00041A68C8|nr:hypothetical protein [Paenibacillus harenae]